MHKVYLKPGKEESLKRFHPWIFSGAIARFDGEPEEGEVVEVYTSKKEFIAEGHFQIGSIAVRVLSFRQEPIDHDFWKRKLQIAYDMRCGIGIAVNPTNDTYRLVHGEGDNLPGLVIDIYARTAVMQAHSAGMHVDRMTIAEALSEVMGDKIENIYYKSETTLPFKADLFPENGFLKGGSSDNIAREYGLMRCLPLVADHYHQLDGYLRSTRAEIHSRLKNSSLYIEFSDENKCYYNMGIYRTKSGEMEFFPRVTDFFIDKNEKLVGSLNYIVEFNPYNNRNIGFISHSGAALPDKEFLGIIRNSCRNSLNIRFSWGKTVILAPDTEIVVSDGMGLAIPLTDTSQDI